MSNLTVEQRIQKEHVWLMKHPKYCLYSGIIMIGKTEVSDDVPTACTDGRNTYYGRDFSDKLNKQELRAVILHENLHKAFRHTTMWQHLYKEWPVVANMACDFVINLLIHDSDPEGADVKLPESGLLDEKFRGLDAGEVFRRLKQEAKDNKSIHIKTVGDQKGKTVPVEEGMGSGGFDEHDWEGAKEMSSEEKEKLGKDIDQALRQGAILAGKLKGNVPREIAELTEAKVDWREALREFITSFCADKDESTWRTPSRRWIGQDVYMPSMIGESVGRLVVAIDMSGSIGPNEIGQFLGEVKHICERVSPEGIDLLYWDTAVCQHEKYERDQLDSLLASTKPRGGGGTMVSAVFDYVGKTLRNPPEACIILTDGYTPFPDAPKYPVLWGMTTEVLAPWGRNIRIST